MSSWPFFVEVTPRQGAPATYDLVVPLQLMDKSREDLADLRLYDLTTRRHIRLPPAASTIKNANFHIVG